MPRILLLETSASVLSVALAQDGTVLLEKLCTEPRSHASKAAPLVKEVLDECGIGIKDCDAVCVSKGPGSYTGLRVGVSTAKGLAFGAGIPLLSAGTLDILVQGVRLQDYPGLTAIVPMMDARRMEVYTAVYSPEGKLLTPVQAMVVDGGSFASELQNGKVLFIGDGALKCKEVLSNPNAVFQEAFPLASNMSRLAEEAFSAKKFENLAYFEPFYLKDFVATVSKKALW